MKSTSAAACVVRTSEVKVVETATRDRSVYFHILYPVKADETNEERPTRLSRNANALDVGKSSIEDRPLFTISMKTSVQTETNASQCV